MSTTTTPAGFIAKWRNFEFVSAQRELDHAVLTTYGWGVLIPTLVEGEATEPTEPDGDSRHPEPVEGSQPPTTAPSPEEELLARLLALNLERA